MKLRNALAILAISIISAALFLGCGASSKDAYESFSLMMDKIAGAGQWSAKGHEDKLQGGKLVVNGLTVNLPPMPLPEVFKEAMAEIHGQDAGEMKDIPRVMTFATVEIKNIADKKSMAALVALENWHDQKALKLADSILLKGVTQQIQVAKDIMESSIEEVSLSAPALSAAGSDGPAGLPGFVKALTLEKYAYKNFKMAGLSPMFKIDASVADISCEKVAFTGTPLSFLDMLDPSGIAGMLSAMSSQKSNLNQMAFTLEGLGEQAEKVSFHMSIDSIDQKGAEGPGKFDELTIKGLKYSFSAADKELENLQPITFSLASLNIQGFDANDYLQKIAPMIEALFTNPDAAGLAILQTQTLGDYIVSPISLKELTVSGLELKASDLFSITLAEAAVSGPFTAGQVAPGQESYIKGLEIVLPEDPKFAEGKTRELYEFGKQFGMTKFTVEGECVGSYDEASGIYTRQTSRLTVKDLFELSAEIELGGLTKDRVDMLKNTSLFAAAMGMQTAPEYMIGDLSFNKLNIKFNDDGLTDRLLAVSAAEASEDMSAQSPISVDAMREMTIVSFKSAMDIRGREILANPEVLADALVSFLSKPESLELNIEAKPPFSFKSFTGFGGDKNKILDSLNLAISSNGNQAQTLKFDIE